MVTTEAEKAAAKQVLHTWHTGRAALAVFVVVAIPALWTLADMDHHADHIHNAIGALWVGGLALLTVVAIRNEGRGRHLAEWKPALYSPATLAGDKRVRCRGAIVYVTALLAVTGFALLVHNMSVNHAAYDVEVATVTNCSGGYWPGDSTCHGSWTVLGRVYSGKLPGVHHASAGDTVHIRCDFGAPSSLGGQSIAIPFDLTLVASVLFGVLAWQWKRRRRDPYLAEVRRIIAMRVRDDTE